MMHSHALHRSHASAPASAAADTQGWVMNLGWRYDAMVWAFDRLIFHGGITSLRQHVVRLAGLRPGDSVLDVGCGTGGVALRASEIVGPGGRVLGIDPGPRQIARAQRRAARHHDTTAEFAIGVIERIPAPEQTFDAVISTLMMHHLPEAAKLRGLAEIARVLKPGGRLVIADFYRPERSSGEQPRFGAGTSGVQDLPALLGGAGFTDIQTGDLGLRRMFGVHGAGFIVARRAADAVA